MPGQKTKKYASWMKYSGMAFQLLILLALAVWGGQKLDEYLELEKPWMTIFLILFLFSGWFYRVYLDLTKAE